VFPIKFCNRCSPHRRFFSENRPRIDFPGANRGLFQFLFCCRDYYPGPVEFSSASVGDNKKKGPVPPVFCPATHFPHPNSLPGVAWRGTHFAGQPLRGPNPPRGGGGQHGPPAGGQVSKVGGVKKKKKTTGTFREQKQKNAGGTSGFGGGHVVFKGASNFRPSSPLVSPPSSVNKPKNPGGGGGPLPGKRGKKTTKGPRFFLPRGGRFACKKAPGVFFFRGGRGFDGGAEVSGYIFSFENSSAGKLIVR